VWWGSVAMEVYSSTLSTVVRNNLPPAGLRIVPDMRIYDSLHLFQGGTSWGKVFFECTFGCTQLYNFLSTTV
jgi:hypothetical protein